MILLKYFMYGILASGILIFIAKVLLYGIAHRGADYYEKKYEELDRAALSGISEEEAASSTDSDADKDIRDLSDIPGIVHEDEGGEEGD